jgi:hypothetical protein
MSDTRRLDVEEALDAFTKNIGFTPNTMATGVQI